MPAVSWLRGAAGRAVAGVRGRAGARSRSEAERLRMVLVFGEFRLDAARRELWRDGRLVAVEPQVFDLLVHLALHRDRVVGKDELFAAVWQGRVVSESTLTSRINALRTAVGDSGERQSVVRTVARKGFRFVAELREEAQAGRADPPEAALRPGAPPGKPSIAVLPFANMSGDPEQEYFSDGVTEEIITALARLHWFFVIARNSTFAYKGRAQDIRRIGRELDVRYILEGSVRKSGPRVRVTCQLLDAGAGNHIWSERYDRELTDIFALQDDVATRVISAIEPRLLAAEGMRATTRRPGELDAWDLVARALSRFWRFTATDSSEAIAILRRAVAAHPDYAPAHSMLACAILLSSYIGWTPPGWERDLAATLAYRAAALDEGDPWAQLGLGIVALTGRLTEDAVRFFHAALERNPNFAAAEGFVGFALALDGRGDQGLPHFERAMRLSPRDPFNSIFLAGTAAAHYQEGRYDDAADWARRAIQMRPEYIGGHRILCASLAQAGRGEEAAAALTTLRRLAPGISVTLARLSVPYTARAAERFAEGLRKAGMPE